MSSASSTGGANFYIRSTGATQERHILTVATRTQINKINHFMKKKISSEDRNGAKNVFTESVRKGGNVIHDETKISRCS